MGGAPREAERLAERLAADAEAPLDAALATSSAVALAWALKATCYGAWHAQPARAVRAAGRLKELAARASPTDTVELRALAAWTAGIAHLIEGAMEPAVAAFDAARLDFIDLDRPDAAAQTQVPKLMALSLLGRYDEALACGEQTRADFLAQGDLASAGRVELNLGLMLSYRHRHAEAAQWHRSAALRFARLRDVQQSIVADINLALALSWLFDFDEAARIYRRARMRAAQRGYTVLEALAHGGLGRIELHRGRHDRALPELALACANLAAAGVAPQQLIEAESFLADAYLGVNLLPEALALYDRALERSEALGSPTHEAWALLQRARVLMRMGEAPAAEGSLVRAQAIYEAQGNVASAALARLSQAAIDLAHDAAPRALETARAAMAVLASTGMRAWHHEAEVMAAHALLALGDLDAARAAYEHTLAAAQGLASIEIACLNGLGRIARAQHQPQQAEAAFERAVQRFETQRALLPGDEFRAALGAEMEASFDALVELALDEQAVSSGQLWRQMERGRARALEIGVRAGPASAGSTISHDERTRLSWLREQSRQALAHGRASEAAALDAQAGTAEQALLEAHRREALATAARSGPAATPLPSAVMDVEAFCATLPADLAIVQYHALGDRWMACVLTHDGVQHRVWSAPGLAATLEDLRFQIEALRHGTQALQAHAQQLLQRVTRRLQQLHAQCWAPVAPLLGERTRVVVVPHRALHYLPFCALHDGQHWLMERFEISLAPSAAVWRQCVEGLPPRFASATVAGVGGTELPHVATELQAVADCFGPRAVVLAEAQATRAQIEATLAEADVLHLACHGEFRADSPYFSSLALADGPFMLRDAAALPLGQTRLVTLSACEAGRSRVVAGDEPIGLVRGFLMAGVPTVVATLWTIDDAATATLMAGFYRELAATGRPAAALRAAQRALGQRWPHPYHWAAFAVHGRG